MLNFSSKNRCFISSFIGISFEKYSGIPPYLLMYFPMKKIEFLSFNSVKIHQGIIPLNTPCTKSSSLFAKSSPPSEPITK